MSKVKRKARVLLSKMMWKMTKSKMKRIQMITSQTLLNYLQKGLGRFWEELTKQSRNNVVTNVKEKVPDNTKGFNSQHINKEGDKMNKIKEYNVIKVKD